MNYIFCYDIANDKRLHKVAKYLERYGVRIQKSFFEFHGTEEQKDKIKKEILRLIDKEEDKFYIYPLCDKCVKQAIEIGTGSLLVVEDFIIL